MCGNDWPQTSFCKATLTREKQLNIIYHSIALASVKVSLSAWNRHNDSLLWNTTLSHFLAVSSYTLLYFWMANRQISWAQPAASRLFRVYVDCEKEDVMYWNCHDDNAPLQQHHWCEGSSNDCLPITTLTLCLWGNCEQALSFLLLLVLHLCLFLSLSLPPLSPDSSCPLSPSPGTV